MATVANFIYLISLLLGQYIIAYLCIIKSLIVQDSSILQFFGFK